RGLVDRQQERRDPELVDEEVRHADRRRAGRGDRQRRIVGGRRRRGLGVALGAAAPALALALAPRRLGAAAPRPPGRARLAADLPGLAFGPPRPLAGELRLSPLLGGLTLGSSLLRGGRRLRRRRRRRGRRRLRGRRRRLRRRRRILGHLGDRRDLLPRD